jgi:hypothetical protein
MAITLSERRARARRSSRRKAAALRTGQVGRDHAGSEDDPASGALALSHPDRLRAVHEVAGLDTPPQDALDRVTRLAGFVFNAPVVLLTLVDERRQWFLSQQGAPDPWSGASGDAAVLLDLPERGRQGTAAGDRGCAGDVAHRQQPRGTGSRRCRLSRRSFGAELSHGVNNVRIDYRAVGLRCLLQAPLEHPNALERSEGLTAGGARQ